MVVQTLEYFLNKYPAQVLLSNPFVSMSATSKPSVHQFVTVGEDFNEESCSRGIIKLKIINC